MKIYEYDYKNFKRGKFLTDIKRPQGIGGGRLDKFGKRDVVEYMKNGFGKDEVHITADDFNVDFITFCLGNYDESNYWEWLIMPNKKYAEKAKKANLKDFGVEYFPRTDEEKRRDEWGGRR